MQPTSSPVPTPNATAHRTRAATRAHESIGKTAMSATLTLRNETRPPTDHHAMRGYRAGESGDERSQRPAYVIPARKGIVVTTPTRNSPSVTAAETIVARRTISASNANASPALNNVKCVGSRSAAGVSAFSTRCIPR
ncbi:hypothetical protein [Natrinema sp. 1APR25-10V2]|uniref:hypothetical protein n=1 Tax=Natrinema sp. 1APR25-10V2 TaxID=2951081 RepID=UPI0028758156|nr:hypothetical protein [Natrinema sp. 1APR25-10V2]MDS0476082.1 hypothetical protein [Natrinema sp. 1APR25-10V2]